MKILGHSAELADKMDSIVEAHSLLCREYFGENCFISTTVFDKMLGHVQISK